MICGTCAPPPLESGDAFVEEAVSVMLEELVTTKSWWDTVDGLATHTTGDLVARHPREGARFIKQWRKSPDFWLRRTAILFQLGYKDRTDQELLFDVIRENQDNPEFFLQKAIGWSLREYAKTEPDAVIRFVNDQELQGLARREALRILKAQGKDIG